MALVEGCKHALDISVPAGEVEQETARAVAAIQAKVKLPGFRPGKAPAALVKSRFAGDVRQEVLEKLVPRFFQAAAEQDRLQVVGKPNFVDVHFHAGEPLRFKAEFEVAPTVELGEYQGLAVTYAEPLVTDADVKTRLDEIRERKAEYINEEPRPVADGDYAVISLESIAGVDEKVQQDELMLKIGDPATLAGFTENLRGVSPEESREFDVTYPADYDRPALAGRTVRFKATVKAVRRKELPEANDDFAKDLGDYQTLDEVKDAIRKSILAEREHHAREETQHQIIEKLVDLHPFPVPDSYVDRQIEISLENQLRQIAAQGVDPRQLKLDWQKIREAQKDRATRDVRASLILDKIAEREGVGATQEEVDREVQRIARKQREAVALVRPKLQKDGTLNRIAGQIRTEKTLGFLFDKARKEAPRPGESPEAKGAEKNDAE
ncbi:MAG TPA: trigger factor [Bryobacteraceae bacterium]|nr:trigger factor [Bryobacteraceae bacterium]